MIINNFIILKEISSSQFTINHTSQNFVLQVFVDLIIFTNANNNEKIEMKQHEQKNKSN
jgi:hypothetical protein